MIEIGIEEPWANRENRKRSVIPHGSNGFGAILEHRLEDHVQLLVRVAERDLPLGQVKDVQIANGSRELIRLKRGDGEAVVIDHLAVVVPCCKLGLDRPVPQQDSRSRVDGNHFARRKATLLNDGFLIKSVDTHFGTDAEDAVIGDLIPRRPQAVSIKACPDRDSVCEDKRGGTVPRLAEAGVVFVEGGQFGCDLFIPPPGWRNEHRHRVQDRASRHGEHLKNVVEAGGIRASGLDDRLEEVDVGTPEIGFQLRLTGLCPVPVSPDGVDLSVVSQHPEGMGKRPGREGVCAIALVVDAEGRLVIRA